MREGLALGKILVRDSGLQENSEISDWVKLGLGARKITLKEEGYG